MSPKIRVGLIYGGKSGEHDVSLSTAQAVIRSFDHSRYEIVPFYINQQGEWRTGLPLTGAVADKEQLRLASGGGAGLLPAPFFGAAAGSAAEVAATSASGGSSVMALDVVFPLLHGTYGEDGTVQGLLEMANIPYVGSGVLASAVGMDKVMMKKIFAQEGLPQCLFRHFTKAQWEKDEAYF